jgi:hypothetical protein
MVGTAQPLCLSASETEGRRYDMTMNLGKSEITAPHYNAGLDDEMPSSRRGSVFLDIPFYRTGFSATGIFGGPVYENKTNQDLASYGYRSLPFTIRQQGDPHAEAGHRARQLH